MSECCFTKVERSIIDGKRQGKTDVALSMEEHISLRSVERTTAKIRRKIEHASAYLN